MHLNYSEYLEAITNKGFKLMSPNNRHEYGIECETCGPIIPDTTYISNGVIYTVNKRYNRKYYYGDNLFCVGCNQHGVCRFCGTHIMVLDCTCEICTVLPPREAHYNYAWNYSCFNCFPKNCISCDLLLVQENRDIVITLDNQHIYYTCKRCCHVYPPNKNEGLDVKDPGYD